MYAHLKSCASNALTVDRVKKKRSGPAINARRAEAVSGAEMQMTIKIDLVVSFDSLKQVRTPTMI